MTEPERKPALVGITPSQTALAIPPTDCAAQIDIALGWQPGEHREIRVIAETGTRNIITHAVVDSPDKVADAIRDVAYGAGVYITMNPIRPGAGVLRKAGAMLTRAKSGSSTVDTDIERRTCFVIDLDPVRDADTSASDEQVAKARALATTIVEHLHAEGWPNPSLFCSGNGMHLYYRLDLDGGSDLPRRALHGLHERFRTQDVKVDTTVGNAARIMRVPGTWNAKGDDRRLHRPCTVESAGEKCIVTPEQLAAVAVPASTSPSTAGVATGTISSTSLDVDVWLKLHGVKHRGKQPWPGGGDGAHRWVLNTCAFNSSHNRGEAAITQRANGAVGFSCHHNSCSQHSWQEFRTVILAASKVNRVVAEADLRPPYPVDALPSTIQDVVQAQREVTRSDPAAVAVPILTAMLGVIGNAVVVEPWDEWSEVMVAWTAVVAPSGEMKSAMVGIAEKVLHELEESFPPPLPDERRERLVVNDTTVEALGDVASRNPRGLILFRDELSAFLRGIGQYKNSPSADEGFWLSAYEGKRHSVDRRSTGNVTVPKLLVSVLGGIQPAVLRREMGERNRGESGFTARYWFVYPTRKYNPIECPDASASAKLKVARTRLILCLKSFRKIPMVEGRPTVLKFELGAQYLLRKFANEQKAIAFGLPDSSVERTCREKSRGWVAKVAGLIALIRAYELIGPRQDGDLTIPDYQGVLVGESDVECAIRLIGWQLAENAMVYQGLRLDDPNLELDRKSQLALEAIDKATGTVTARDYARKHGVRTEEAERVLEALVEAKLWSMRWPKSGPQGGRPTKQYFPLAGDAVA